MKTARLDATDREEVAAQLEQDRLWFRLNPDRILYLRQPSDIEIGEAGYPRGCRYSLIILDCGANNFKAFIFPEEFYLYDLMPDSNSDEFLIVTLMMVNEWLIKNGRQPFPIKYAELLEIKYRKQARRKLN